MYPFSIVMQVPIRYAYQNLQWDIAHCRSPGGCSGIVHETTLLLCLTENTSGYVLFPTLYVNTLNVCICDVTRGRERRWKEESELVTIYFGVANSIVRNELLV